MNKEENITYWADGIPLNGFIAYDESKTRERPVVLVVHEWWGLNDYSRNRARQLAALGYFAMAVDIYGEGKTAANPIQAREMASLFYGDPLLAKARLDAAILKIKEFEEADATNVAAIGYCFGGSVVLNSAKLGADLKGVVSFHGGLSGVKAIKNLLNAKILVCHGSADKFVTRLDVEAFIQEMDSIGADYTLIEYADATHAFTNPDAGKTGKQFNMPIKYNAAADTASWNDMMKFLNGIFGS
ncbi:MAG: dienelactone hydrolase family protein [Bacteroidota bacterium]